MQERITRFVTEHSSITSEKFNAFMMNTDMMSNDVGTILCGEEAVNCGLIDSTGGIAQSLEKLCELRVTEAT